ncbi:MAG: zf-C3Hc3H domain-containing protein, partial [Halobacteriales archaeon]|nr:zf-C3Hc3H domain-containing protein [Halobacteriales archaeon]
AQCHAVTKGGKQCQNPVVAGSPYCGNHQGYREPTGKQIIDSVDTKPRWSKAKDTKPATRKSAKKAAKRGK